MKQKTSRLSAIWKNVLFERDVKLFLKCVFFVKMSWYNIETKDLGITGNISINGVGDAGYIIQRNVDNTGQIWSVKNTILSVYRQDDYDINNGDEFVSNGAVIYQQGDSFEFLGDGTFKCIKKGMYMFIINGRFDTFNGQSKLRITDGNLKYGICPLSYIPGNTEVQDYYTSIVLPAEVGQIWGFRFESYGVAGTINTIFRDPDYGNFTCGVTILS